MKAGDIVQDEFGNIGIVINTAMFGNGLAVQVQFDPAAGYRQDQKSWVLARLLETIVEGDEYTFSMTNKILL